MGTHTHTHDIRASRAPFGAKKVKDIGHLIVLFCFVWTHLCSPECSVWAPLEHVYQENGKFEN